MYNLFHDDRIPPELGFNAAEIELESDAEWTAALVGCPHPPSVIRHQVVTFAAARLASGAEAPAAGRCRLAFSTPVSKAPMVSALEAGTS
jgi:hypothetical protein